MVISLLMRVILMTTLTIKDNASNNKNDFIEVSGITDRVVDKTLEQLEKEGIFVFPELIKNAEDITKDQVILQSKNDTYRSSNVMGFLGYGKERLVIESRFSNNKEDYFFQYLLERVLDLPNILALNTDTNQDHRIFNLLMFLFPYYLKEAMRKGEFKTYIHKRYNGGHIAGTIDIARHIQKNTPFVGNVAYNKREFSYDNYLMALIRHTIEFINKKTYGNKLLRLVKDEVDTIKNSTNKYEYYDRRKVITLNKKKPIRHAYYREYRTLQKLCIMILQHDEHQLGRGTKQKGCFTIEKHTRFSVGNLVCLSFSFSKHNYLFSNLPKIRKDIVHKIRPTNKKIPNTFKKSMTLLNGNHPLNNKQGKTVISIIKK